MAMMKHCMDLIVDLEVVDKRDGGGKMFSNIVYKVTQVLFLQQTFSISSGIGQQMVQMHHSSVSGSASCSGGGLSLTTLAPEVGSRIIKTE